MPKMAYTGKRFLLREYRNSQAHDVEINPYEGYFDEERRHWDYDADKIKQCLNNPGVWVWL